MFILNAEPKNYNKEARVVLDLIGTVHEECCDRERLLQLIPKVNVLITRLGHRIDRQVLERAGRLEVIVTATTGLNHIDLDVVREYGVEVLSLKGEREFLNTLTATAEMTWALLLGLLRHLLSARAHVMDGGWDRDLYRGRQLKGKTLGVVGFGRLGSIVAEYGRAFKMEVVAYDPYVTYMPEWVKQVEFRELLRESDVVSLHVNLDSSTHGFFDKRAFSSMKQGAVLINTSRGELVDEGAMLEALDSDRLAGVALDVLAGETENNSSWPANNPVWRYAKVHDNVLIVPHTGGATFESMADAEVFMARKLERFLVENNIS